MKKKIFIAGVITIVILMLAGCNSQKEKKELSVLAWNIWHGGHSKKYPKVGCEGTLGILKKSGADVILMIETYGASAKVADELGYYHRLLSSNLSIYSRYPITKTYVFSDSISTFNFGGVEIDMEGTKVRLFDTWLHYLPDSRFVPTDKSEAEILAWDDAGSRDDEIRKILTVIEPFLKETDSIPIIMGGDFNSNSHLDWTEATKDMYYHGGVAKVNWTVSKEMETAGFKDSFRELNPDPVKNLGFTIGIKRERPTRIDYVYYKGATVQAIESETYYENQAKPLSINGKEFFFASDHGLVLTTFKIK